MPGPSDNDGPWASYNLGYAMKALGEVSPPGCRARMGGMTIKERLHKLIDSLPDTPEAERTLEAAEHILDSNSNGGTARKKAGRLSFSAIGAGDPPDASERVDEFVGLAIDKRHPRS